jgi:hypothetical protein
MIGRHRRTWIVAAILVGAAVAGCAPNVVATPSAVQIPSSPTPPAETFPLGPRTPIAGGCDRTQVFTGPGPDAAGADAIIGLDGLPWATASPAAVGITAYFFRPPPDLLVVGPPPTPPDNKILWVSQGNLSGDLLIEARPVGSSTPAVQFKLPAAGRDYPSLIELPSAGCWQLDIGATGATIDLLVGPTATVEGGTPSAPWWAVGGLSACGRPAVSRLSGRLTYLGGCDANFGEPAAVISMSTGELLDLHMLTDGAGGPPLYPLPTSTDTKVVLLVATQDAATATYEAVGVGSATLMSNGNCSSTTVSQFNGPCPVIQLNVSSP